ncbi:tRNA (adenosine(37)-N6)-threonylcarbamoyltransferase complex ATPase subunit type 1 TsaE [Pseudoalteromonas sp. S16_S37]|uniref:tRNA (adenosine(37)-N6)-threonylcarbamoyltransferase complex ATPase subunit type 1 TsaE n=1 Tax=Pseudoalteromonas sp. S16_S37 TaxID=2720228 RepID=UPI001681B466|nr:tRNA (adenosine(37)-N6)-threonylcarbamoyltransferase complex ATPase subunit type 1 TsaE [Pseudoalteromonas sp. S16_S37]MBD1580751.1 tRNA (adenosine(37)-N6)-threonylcarbamoyltransferase complex ATPase subunit type 1 TsaE [Pseudoalteromonas sp. S16_S37]
MSNTFSQHLADEAQTVAMGERLCKYIKNGAVLFLHGDLGAGKTTLSRGIVQGMGHTGKVKSPTYTLVEPYELEDVSIYHFDLYRLGDPEELEYMGIRDYFSPNAICIIEWPQKGAGFIPSPDLNVEMAYDGEQRTVTVSANSERGQTIVMQLGQDG